jgi:hypothetical protein
MYSSCTRFEGIVCTAWKLAFGLVSILLLAGCRVFVTPIPAPPTLQLSSESTAEMALMGTLGPVDHVTKLQTSTPIPELVLSSQRYTEAQNLFSLNPPTNWIVVQSNNETRFNDPGGASWISLQVINSSYAYDPETFTQLISTREANTFNGYLAYFELERLIQAAEGSARVTKGVVVDNIEKRVFSFYRQDGPAILTMDCWTDVKSFAVYLNGFEKIIGSLQFNGQAAAAVTPINKKLFQDQQNTLAFEVPVFWTYKHIAGDKTTSDTFSAPDQHAAVQSLVYEDSEVISKALAGEFTLDLLHEYYNRDIIITSERILVDGGERLDWYSSSGSYFGATIFRTRGRTIWLFTMIVDDAYEAIYQGLLADILASTAFN